MHPANRHGYENMQTLYTFIRVGMLLPVELRQLRHISLQIWQQQTRWDI
jgi:hypothetical protein